MQPKVSVIVLTYNHERYILKALESIVSQNVNFHIEILVFEDGSTDTTLEIVKDFQQKYPKLITIFSNAINQGIKNNVLNVFSKVKGEYVAILDGDDYWSYSEKLQTQITFLEENTDYNGVFHDTEIRQVGNAQHILFNQKKYYTQIYNFTENSFPSDIISREITIPSSSIVMRTNSVIHIDKSLFTDKFSLLWKITCWAVRWSKFYFINEPWSVYHNHIGGISKSNKLEFHLSHITFLTQLLNDEFYKDYKYAIYKAISHEYQVILNSCDKINKKIIYRHYFWNEMKRLWWYRKKIL